MKKVLDVVMIVLGLVALALIIISMYQPIKLWIPLLLIVVESLVTNMRMIAKNKKNGEDK